MKAITKVAGIGFALFMALSLIGFSIGIADAKFEVFKQEKENHPDLKCATCHIVPVPKKGDEDKKLNETGKFYQQNKTFPPKK